MPNADSTVVSTVPNQNDNANARVISYLPTEYQKFIHLSRYSRYRDDLGRRETWEETIDRLMAFLDGHITGNLSKKAFEKYHEVRSTIRESILSLNVMPSMRLMMTAGEAARRNNIAIFNCSFAGIDGDGGKEIVFESEELDEPIRIKIANPIVFDEAMVILMHGCGFGFSVENRFVRQLPKVGKRMNRRIYLKNNKNYPGVAKEDLSDFDKTSNTILVADTREGWASALRILIVELYNANFSVQWDLSKIRKAGERLKTFGGRSSGPSPLDELFRFCVSVFKNANGRRLKSIEAHDILCKIASVVIAGSSRRSALISLSDASDDDVRYAKNGNWWEANQQRALSNNSISYKERPTMAEFLREWKALIDSKSGERGIVNLDGLRKHASANGRRNGDLIDGTNPCGEVALRNREFCNLTSVIVRANDTEESLKSKVEVATILGTIQSTMTDFKYISAKWKENCDEERLLGVSMSGILDNPLTSGLNKDVTIKTLDALREHAITTNKTWSETFGVHQSVAVSTVKPEGTCSQLTDSSSGIHPRFSKYYIRTVRIDKKDSMYNLMVSQRFPCEDDVTNPDHTAVFSFPIKSPDFAITRDKFDAMAQLQIWSLYADHWCEHEPSCTVYVRDHEWLDVGAWVYNHFDKVRGLSFLPYADHIYKQAPYQEITEAQYKDLLSKMPKADWSKLSEFEHEDNTVGSQSLSCTAGACELVDLTK